MGIALVLLAVVFTHYNGWNDPAFAAMRMLASAFWGGLTLASIFIALMAVLFLSA
jgi:hypothetical protein